MKKNTLFCFITSLFVLYACSGGADTQTDANHADSLSSEIPQDKKNKAVLSTDTNQIQKITYEIFSDSGAVALERGSPDSPVASFKEEILVVTKVPNQTNLKVIQAILQQSQKYSGDAQKALAEKKKVYLESYIEMNSAEIMGASAEWYVHQSITVLYNANYFTSISFFVDEYGGGARSYYTASYVVLDLKNSKQIFLSDIFDANGITKLTQKLTDKALKMAKGEGASSLEDYGFSVEEIKPTERFWVDESGIHFDYLRSEITFGTTPPPSFSFQWSEIKDIMKADSPFAFKN